MPATSCSLYELRRPTGGSRRGTGGRSRAPILRQVELFHKREGAGFSRHLQAAEETLAAIPKYHGYASAIWTTHQDGRRNAEAPTPKPSPTTCQELPISFSR